MSMNSWSFTGRLGRDAELRSTNSGEQVLQFSVAVDVGYGNNKSTLWPRCSLWGRRGQAIVDYMTKGKQVGVVGEVSMREHNGKQYLDVRVNDLTLLGGKDDSQQGYSQPQQTQQQARPASNQQPAADGFADFDDEIPF